MTIQWSYLSLALVLLLPPLPFSAALQRSLLSLRRSSLASAGATARVWQNWADLARAGLGAFLLIELAIVADESVPGEGMRAAALQAAILGGALLIQTVRVGPGVHLIAPMFYLCGLTLALGGWLQGSFAIAVGWLFAIGGKNLLYQLPAMAVALVAAGSVLGLSPNVFVGVALILLPLVLSTLFRKRLLFAALVPVPV